MLVEAQVNIHRSSEAVWAVITDIEHAAERISGIQAVEVLEKPDDGLVGLKWRETRTIFGKTATEVMWITEVIENESYKVRAESHGCVYESNLGVSEHDGISSLTMTHLTTPQSFMAKLLSAPMGLVFKGAMKKCLVQDLDDIKAAVEQR